MPLQIPKEAHLLKYRLVANDFPDIKDFAGVLATVARGTKPIEAIASQATNSEVNTPPAQDCVTDITSSSPASVAEQLELVLPDGVKTRKCVKCGEKKTFDKFPKHDTNADGIASYCKECKNELSRKRRQTDPFARILHYTVTRIKNEWPSDKVPKDIHTNLEHYLGYKLSELIRHLRHTLKQSDGITLIEAFERGYHLDHIRPHKTFKMVKIGDETFQACWAIKNLKLIPAKDNLQKGSKITTND